MRQALLHPVSTFREDWDDLSPAWRALLVVAMLLGSLLGFASGIVGGFAALAYGPF